MSQYETLLGPRPAQGVLFSDHRLWPWEWLAAMHWLAFVRPSPGSGQFFPMLVLGVLPTRHHGRVSWDPPARISVLFAASRLPSSPCPSTTASFPSPVR